MLPEFKDLVFYEIYPNSFKDSNGDGYGDLQGIISKIDYVKSIGFNAIWLNPIYDSPFKDGGYDVRDPFAISPRYGSLDDLKELISVMHKKNMRLFLDLIPGHMSCENKDFLKSALPYENECSDLFIWNDNVWDNCNGKYRLISGVYDRFGCFMVNFFEHQPAINYGFNIIDYPTWQKDIYSSSAKKGRDYLKKIMKFYLNLGIDGFRVDMADSLVKNDDDKTMTIKTWNIILDELKEEGYKDFFMTSEWSNPSQALKAGFTSDFILDHDNNCSHYLFRQNKNGEKPLLVAFNEELYKKFIADLSLRIQAANDNKKYLSFISGNHDTRRIASFLTGNSLKLAYLFLLTIPGVPYIYYGDELGAHTLDAQVSVEGGYQRTGSRLPMKFDHNKNYGFSSSDSIFLTQIKEDLCAEDAIENKDSILNLVKDLISIREKNSDFTSNKFEFIAYKFGYKRGKFTILINLFDSAQSYKIDSNAEVIYQIGDYVINGSSISLSSHSGVIIKE